MKKDLENENTYKQLNVFENMFQRKPPKTERAARTPFTDFNYHTDTSKRNWDQGYYQVVSIDPAVRKNLAIRIERRYPNGNIKMIVYQNTRISSFQDDDVYYKEAYNEVSRILKEHHTHFLESHIFLVERQMTINYKAVRVSQHIITYLMEHLRDTSMFPLIVEVNSQNKTQQLGAPRGLRDKQIKEWAIDKAYDLLNMRQDQESLKILDKAKKKDDLADTVVQIEAMFVYWKLPMTKEWIPTRLIED